MAMVATSLVGGRIIIVLHDPVVRGARGIVLFKDCGVENKGMLCFCGAVSILKAIHSYQLHTLDCGRATYCWLLWLRNCSKC
eukprot:1138344-Pelagomonas_calceolata.AAC.1